MNNEAYSKAHRSLALYDASHRYGRVSASGVDAIDLLHRMSTNDLLPLIGKEGIGAQTVLTTEKGRIIDLLTVLSAKATAMLITSGGREDIVIEWLNKFVIMEDAKFEKKTDEILQYLLFGPKALQFFEGMGHTGLIGMMNFQFVQIVINGYKVILQKTHRIIESGWAILVEKDLAEGVWQYLQMEVENMGGTVIDDHTYDLLRIEAGIPIAPNELNEKHNPLETTLVQAVSFTKGCYIGQEVIARLDTYDKVQRHLMGIEMSDGIDNTHALPLEVLNAENEKIGEVTSMAFSPALGKSVGLGFIKTAYAIPEMQARVGNEKLAAKLVKLPFEI